MTDFWQVINTPSFIPRLMHVFMASWTVGAALMLSVSSWYLLKKRHVDLAKSNLKVALPLFILFASVNVVIFGANQAVEVTQNQPLKLASMEGLFQSESCARMFVVGWVDAATQTTTGISIPCLLSFLAYQNVNATVAGINSFAPAPTPPINLDVPGLSLHDRDGPALAAIGLLGGLMFLWKRRLYESRLVLWLFVITVFIGEATITAGWWTAEIGRQPWVVYNVLLTADGVSPTPRRRSTSSSRSGCSSRCTRSCSSSSCSCSTGRSRPARRRSRTSRPSPCRNLPDTFREIFRRPRAGRRPGGGAMTINDVWFALFILIIAGYLILDGFDMGVGILLLPWPATDAERRTFLNSIGPVWDGNEVWLVLGGGVLFAVFPLAYASLFSGLYLAVHAGAAGDDPAHGRARVPLARRTARAGALPGTSSSVEPRSAWRCCWASPSATSCSGVPLDADGNISIELSATC